MNKAFCNILTLMGIQKENGSFVFSEDQLNLFIFQIGIAVNVGGTVENHYNQRRRQEFSIPVKQTFEDYATGAFTATVEIEKLFSKD